MRPFHRTLLAAVLLATAGCSDDSAPPTAPAVADREAAPLLGAAAQPQGIAAIGVIDEVDLQQRTLVLLQTGLDFIPGAGVTIRRHTLAIGAVGEKLRVAAAPDAKVYLDAAEKTFGDLKVGTRLIVAGRATGEGLEATTITDLTPVEPPPGVAGALRERATAAISAPLPAGAAATEGASLCYAQNLDYPDLDVLEFHGCWAGPSAGNTIETDLPFAWIIVGYLKIDYFSYFAGLSGYTFAWPFRFTATPSSPLVYHVPTQVSLGVQGLTAQEHTFTFTGGIGLDLGVNIDICIYVAGCSDLDTFHIGVGQTWESGGAPPTDPNVTLDVEEPTCISAGVIPIKGFSPLSISYCTDLTFQGQPFRADVKAIGSRPMASDSFAFERGTYGLSVRPDSTAVRIRFDDMRWKPNHSAGGYFTFNVFDWEVLRSPNIFDTPHGGLGFVDPDFPPPLGMTLATKRSTGEQLEQPKFIDFTLPVAPAPTELRFLAGEALAEGTPVTVRLSERYDDAAIPGQPISIRATGIGAASSVDTTVTTDAAGTASLLLPPGEYEISAQFAGTSNYQPSSAARTSFFVFRPTTFVIWGGNAGGIPRDATVQFWGTGWARQVLNGAYGGNASFKGFALPFGDDMWAANPGSSGKEPATIPNMIAVIVTTRVEGRGSNTVGNIAGYALLRVDRPSVYQPNSGHPAAGVVRRMLE